MMKQMIDPEEIQSTLIEAGFDERQAIAIRTVLVKATSGIDEHLDAIDSDLQGDLDIVRETAKSDVASLRESFKTTTDALRETVKSELVSLREVVKSELASSREVLRAEMKSIDTRFVAVFAIQAILATAIVGYVLRVLLKQ